ncbi:hypothetical protein G7Y89_g3678 [Cudoniella acicularis]|uniref:2-methoxy-6-polyprenyl-1,4-benzoquinol methylase, mitochondrial n=1 Tax=Cudoniella acicularis TaxID=354080 RepID=A0A8H4RQW6_9HELO|nr:hypothetical protein G7Y89_g3678 [Cudoniella acicularis]
MTDCKMSPKPSQEIKIVAAGQSGRGLDFASKYADFNFAMGSGINTPKAVAPANARLVEAAEKSGRDIGVYTLFMVIADETNELAEAKWQKYKDGADVDALAWMADQGGKDTKADANATAKSINLPEGAVNFNQGLFLGSFEKVAGLLDEAAEVPGTKGIMLVFDDFLEGLESYGPSSDRQSSNAPPTSHERTTHFGFETVAEAEKEARVAGVFSNVATSYDAMNDFMSLGIHRLWKDYFVRSINPGSSSSTSPSEGWKMLDIAGGTGDIAFRLLDHSHTINNSPSSSITISDINPSMLEEGRKRSLQTPYANSPILSFLIANAEDLNTVPSNSIDLYTVAFGIRNFTDKDKALREAYRVLKPGGLFACLEFSGVTNPLLDAVYKRWSFGAIPLIGELVSGDRASYQYLVESIERFPKQEEFRDMIKAAGFVVPGKGWEDLTGGIAAIHKGIKPVEKS